MKLELTRRALHDLSRLPKATAGRILDKMEWYTAQDDPLSFAKPLKDSTLGTHRFRIGAYRVLVEVRRNHIIVIFVLAVKHRKEAYRL